MLQNRVDPFGNIIVTDARGAWMGNRGVIHNDHKQIIHVFKHKAWITCVLNFKERRREVMSPGRWTELFFLDEVTAFSAGHRPCFECRREAATKFKHYWLLGNPEYKLNMSSSIRLIDEIIHRERIDSKKNKVTFESPTSTLVPCTFIKLDKQPYLFFNELLYRWTPHGYDAPVDFSQRKSIEVLTPASIVNMFRTGYIPEMKIALPTQ